MARQPFKRARDLASEVLVEIGATSPEHIDPIKSAQKNDIEIAFGGLSGATARVCRDGSKAKIRVSDEIVQPGRRWFSIAHEIGHYLLGHAIANERSASSWERLTCDKRPPREEREADAFAVAHNMPADMVREHCVLSPLDWSVARVIAGMFPASPVAAALRAVELSDGACAAVYSVGGVVLWAKRSPTFPGRIPQGKRLDISALGTALEDAQSIPEPGWGGVLSLVWLPPS